MADSVSVKFLNKERLLARFRALVPASREELTFAAVESAKEVAELAKRLTRSDRVRNSITVEPDPDRMAAKVIAGDAGSLVEARKGSGQFIQLARIEEFGTRPHKLGGLFKGARHPGTKPHPFLFPAARLMKKETQKKMGRAISKAAKKVGGR